TQAVQKITTNKTQNVAVNKNVAITQLQNATVLSPVKKVNNTRVTALAGLAGAEVEKKSAVVRKLEPVSKEKRVQEQKTVGKVREVGRTRQESEWKYMSDRSKQPKPGAAPDFKVKLPPHARPAVPPPKAGDPKKQPAKAPPPPTLPKFTDQKPPKVKPPKN